MIKISKESKLDALKKSLSRKDKLNFFKLEENKKVKVESIKEADFIQFEDNDKNIFDLNEITNFYNDDKPQDFRSVVFCYLHDKSSILDYKNDCSESNIADFKFLVKTELNTWLNGNSDTCAFIKNEEVDSKEQSDRNLAGESKIVDLKEEVMEDECLKRFKSVEKDLIDHNMMLRGTKNIDFKYLISDFKKLIHFLQHPKNALSQSKIKTSDFSKKLPIIIISPATTSLLSLSNVKSFFENSEYVENDPTKKMANGLVMINHNFSKLTPSPYQIIVVDNVDIFTKPDYWNRVVAIFTTGQEWQFSKYKYPNPEFLFQRYAGFYLSYIGDLIPEKIQKWNVSVLEISRGKDRFRDKMIVNEFWSRIEKILLTKGYGKNSAF